MQIVWNEPKNQESQRKHGISFDEARKIFAPGSDYLFSSTTRIPTRRIAFSP